MLMGATIVPGAELIPGGYILLVIVVTYWWVGIKRKKAWLCYGVECGSDKAETVGVGTRRGYTTPPSTKEIVPIFVKEREMTAPLKCPLCGSEFSYKKEDVTLNTVLCQNCLEYLFRREEIHSDYITCLRVFLVYTVPFIIFSMPEHFCEPTQ
jgi:hypothetical protein